MSITVDNNFSSWGTGYKSKGAFGKVTRNIASTRSNALKPGYSVHDPNPITTTAPYKMSLYGIGQTIASAKVGKNTPHNKSLQPGYKIVTPKDKLWSKEHDKHTLHNQKVAEVKEQPKLSETIDYLLSSAIDPTEIAKWKNIKNESMRLIHIQNQRPLTPEEKHNFDELKEIVRSSLQKPRDKVQPGVSKEETALDDMGFPPMSNVLKTLMSKLSLEDRRKALSEVGSLSTEELADRRKALSDAGFPESFIANPITMLAGIQEEKKDIDVPLTVDEVKAVRDAQRKNKTSTMTVKHKVWNVIANQPSINVDTKQIKDNLMIDLFDAQHRDLPIMQDVIMAIHNGVIDKDTTPTEMVEFLAQIALPASAV